MRKATAARLGSTALASVALFGFGWWLYTNLNRDSSSDWIRVAREDLALTVEVSGTLKAVHSHPLGPPPIRGMREFKISQMAPEGSEVKKGAPVLAFDASERTRQLEEKKAELETAQKEIEK